MEWCYQPAVSWPAFLSRWTSPQLICEPGFLSETLLPLVNAMIAREIIQCSKIFQTYESLQSQVEWGLPTIVITVGNPQRTVDHCNILCDKSVWNGFGPLGDPGGVEFRDVFQQSRSLRDHLAP